MKTNPVVLILSLLLLGVTAFGIYLFTQLQNKDKAGETSSDSERLAKVKPYILNRENYLKEVDTFRLKVIDRVDQSPLQLKFSGDHFELTPEIMDYICLNNDRKPLILRLAENKEGNIYLGLMIDTQAVNASTSKQDTTDTTALYAPPRCPPDCKR